MSEFNQYRPQSNFGIPTVVKNLLIINVLFYIATLIMDTKGINLYTLFADHFPTAPDFRVWQPITSMFMHDRKDVMHLAVNMLGLFVFGVKLEQYWGPQRFLTYYMVTGIGASIAHYTVLYFTMIRPYEMQLTAAGLSGEIYGEYMDALLNYATVSLGASGAIFGLLLAYGMLFPNTELMLMFFPVPIKAKYFVIGYGLVELFSGIRNSANDNVAHFAHLGGMLFGFIMIKYWNKKYRNRFY